MSSFDIPLGDIKSAKNLGGPRQEILRDPEDIAFDEMLELEIDDWIERKIQKRIAATQPQEEAPGAEFQQGEPGLELGPEMQAMMEPIPSTQANSQVDQQVEVVPKWMKAFHVAAAGADRSIASAANDFYHLAVRLNEGLAGAWDTVSGSEGTYEKVRGETVEESLAYNPVKQTVSDMKRGPEEDLFLDIANVVGESFGFMGTLIASGGLAGAAIKGASWANSIVHASTLPTIAFAQSYGQTGDSAKSAEQAAMVYFYSGLGQIADKGATFLAGKGIHPKVSQALTEWVGGLGITLVQHKEEAKAGMEALIHLGRLKKEIAEELDPEKRASLVEEAEMHRANLYRGIVVVAGDTIAGGVLGTMRSLPQAREAYERHALKKAFPKQVEDMLVGTGHKVHGDKKNKKGKKGKQKLRRPGFKDVDPGVFVKDPELARSRALRTIRANNQALYFAAYGADPTTNQGIWRARKENGATRDGRIVVGEDGGTYFQADDANTGWTKVENAELFPKGAETGDGVGKEVWPMVEQFDMTVRPHLDGDELAMWDSVMEWSRDGRGDLDPQLRDELGAVFTDEAMLGAAEQSPSAVVEAVARMMLQGTAEWVPGRAAEIGLARVEALNATLDAPPKPVVEEATPKPRQMDLGEAKSRKQQENEEIRAGLEPDEQAAWDYIIETEETVRQVEEAKKQSGEKIKDVDVVEVKPKSEADTKAEFDPLPPKAEKKPVEPAKVFEPEAQAKVELLMRELGIGHTRANTMVEEMLREGVSEKPVEPGEGKRVKVKTDAGTEIEAAYRVAEIDDIAASHTDTLQPNPKYPGELQPRDRGRTQGQIDDIATKLDPERLGENVMASDGAPITSKGIIESGNGRFIALSRAYRASGTKMAASAADYRLWLTENAERFGLSADDIKKMKEPVLVRERLTDMTDADRLKFTREANESTVARMSPTEQAKVDSDTINATLMRKFNPGDNGELGLSQNNDFLTDFIGRLPKSEQDGLRTKDGAVSKVLIERVRNAIMQRAYGDPELVGRLAEDTDPDFKNYLAALTHNAGRAAEIRHLQDTGKLTKSEYPVTDSFVGAFKFLDNVRREGLNVEAELGQPQLFGGGLTPDQRAVAKVFNEWKRSPKKLRNFQRAVLDTVETLGDPNQSKLFGDETPTFHEIVEAAYEAVTRDSGKKPDEATSLYDPPAKEVGGEQTRRVDAPEPAKKEQAPKRQSAKVEAGDWPKPTKTRKDFKSQEEYSRYLHDVFQVTKSREDFKSKKAFGAYLEELDHRRGELLSPTDPNAPRLTALMTDPLKGEVEAKAQKVRKDVTPDNVTKPEKTRIRQWLAETQSLSYAEATRMIDKASAENLRKMLLDSRDHEVRLHPESGVLRVGPKTISTVLDPSPHLGLEVPDTVGSGIMTKLRREFIGAAKFFEDLGGAGVKAAKSLREIGRKMAGQAATDTQALKKIFKGEKVSDLILAMKLANNYREPLYVSAKVRDLTEKIRVVMDRSLNSAIEMKMMRRSLSGKMIELAGSGEYYPQVLNEYGKAIMDAVRQGKTDARVLEAAQKIIESGQAKTVEEAIGFMTKWNQERLRSTNAYLEGSRIKLPEEMIEWNPKKTLEYGLQQSWKTVEAVREFGFAVHKGTGEVYMPGANSIADSIGGASGKAFGEIFRGYIESQFSHARQKTAPESRAAGSVSGYLTITRLGGSIASAARNGMQALTNAAHYPWRYFARSYKELPPQGLFWMKTVKDMRAKLERGGSLGGVTSITDVDPGFLSGVQRVLMWPFSTMENGVQARASMVAYVGMQADLTKLIQKTGQVPEHMSKVGEILSAVVGENEASLRRRIEKLGVSKAQIEAAVKRGRWTTDEMESAAYRMVADTQFRMDVSTKRLWYDQNPWKRPLYKFKQFGVDQYLYAMKYVLKEGRHGNVAPMVRFFVANVVSGELYHELTDLISGGERSMLAAWLGGDNLDPFDEDGRRKLGGRLLDDAKAGGGIGFLMDMGYGIDNYFLGPLFGALKNYASAGAAAIQDPRLGLDVAANLAKKEMKVVRDASQASAHVDKLLGNEENRYRAINIWKSRAYEWKKQQKYPTVVDKIWQIAIDTLQGQIERRIEKNTFPLSKASEALKRGDVTTAASFMKSILDRADPKDRRKLISGIETSMNRQGPKGPVAQDEIKRWLHSYSKSERDEWIALQRGYSRLTRLALRQAAVETRPQRLKEEAK